MSYLAIELDPGAEPVHGHVFESEHLSDYWDEIDAFEGSDYERISSTVELPDRTVIEAFIYVARRNLRSQETPPPNTPA